VLEDASLCEVSRAQPDEPHSCWPLPTSPSQNIQPLLGAISSPVPAQLSLAAWPTGWTRAGCIMQVQPRRQGRVFKIHILNKKLFKSSRIIIYSHSEVLTEKYPYSCSHDPSFRAPAKPSEQLSFTEKGDARTLPFLSLPRTEETELLHRGCALTVSSAPVPSRHVLGTVKERTQDTKTQSMTSSFLVRQLTKQIISVLRDFLLLLKNRFSK